MDRFGRQKPLIDQKYKTLGATCPVPIQALKSYKATFAQKQKRYWCEPSTKSNVNNSIVKPCSLTRSRAARPP